MLSEKLRREVGIIISECVLECFYHSLSTNYTAYCYGIHNSLKAGLVNTEIKFIIEKTGPILTEFLGIRESEASRLIMLFFIDKDYEERARITQICKDLFGGYFFQKTNERKRAFKRKNRVNGFHVK